MRYRTGGSILDGIMRPPSNMEGKKIDWLRRGTALKLGATTPINKPRLAKVNAVRININTKYPQFSGMPALKNGPAVNVITMETRDMCTKLLNTGIVAIESAGTPLILKLRNIPASREATIGLGRPNKVHDMIVTRIIAGIMVAAKVGFRPVKSKPNIT